MRGPHPSRVEANVRGAPPRAMTAIGVFLFLGAIMASLAGTTLIWRGTLLDHMWTLNALAYGQLSPFGKTVGIPFLVLSAALAAAGLGWFARRLWGWKLAVVIIATQVLGDLVSIFMGQFVRGAVGVTIAGALLFYLLRPEVRGAVVARFILTRYGVQRYHRRRGDLMVGLGGDAYCLINTRTLYMKFWYSGLGTVAWSARACLTLTLVVKTMGRSGGGLLNRFRE
jgi:hypothetical protein